MKLLSIAAGRLRRALTLCGVLLALAPAARAQEQIGVNVPFLVKDINTTAGARLGSNPRDYAVIGAVAYFAATDPVWGTELWRSDGTAAGTVMLRDIFPGAGSSNPMYLTNVGGLLYFFADDGIHGAELWRSDGTPAGTRMVRNIFPGNVGSLAGPPEFTLYNGKIYFLANDGVNGRELWRSDGSEAGTVLVKNIMPGIGSPAPCSLRAFAGKLYFLADQYSPWGSFNRTLWQSDGSAAGTVPLKSLGAVSATILENLGGALYFITTDSTGDHLWKSDGSAAGCVRLKDLPTGMSFPTPSPLAELNGKVYLIHRNTTIPSQPRKELWRSDGTPGGTVLLWSFPANPSTPAGYGKELVSAGGALYFAADNGVNGEELWRSDGSAAGTRLVKDLWAGKNGSMPQNLMSVRGKAWFTANDGRNGTQLWQSDGSAAGTVMLSRAIQPDSSLGMTTPTPPPAPVTANGTFFFTASDAVHGTEVWKTNGTLAGTALVKEIAVGSDSGPCHLTAGAGTLYFGANDLTHGLELWKSNVSPASTMLVKDIRPGPASGLSYEGGLAEVTGGGYLRSRICYAYGNAWLIASDGSHGIGLWKSNGTAAGTVAVKDGFIEINDLIADGGRILFLAEDAIYGLALWQTNSTGTGATPLSAFGTQCYPAMGGHALAIANGTVFCLTMRTGAEAQLWRSDSMLPLASAVSPDSDLIAVGDKVFFLARDGAGPNLFVSDGSKAGTRMVKEIAPGGVPEISNMTAVGNVLYFSASDGVHGHELWKSDGTAAGTVMVKDIWAGPGRAYPRSLTAVGGTLYFSADDGLHGPELWKSNGTAAGTVLVRDIYPGPYGSNPSSMADVYGTLYFNAAHPSVGNELWKSNGTAAGTGLVSDAITPGFKGSNPTNLTLVSSFLYFSAANYNTTQGRELWAVRVR